MQVSDEMVKVALDRYGSDDFNNDTDAMHAALTAALALSGWRTIDSAPPNETVLVWWPIVAIDDYGDLTDQVVGGECLVSELQGGQWLEPDVLNALNSVAFDDDREYAPDPTLWRPRPAPPATAGKEG